MFVCVRPTLSAATPASKGVLLPRAHAHRRIPPCGRLHGPKRRKTSALARQIGAISLHPARHPPSCYPLARAPPVVRLFPGPFHLVLLVVVDPVPLDHPTRHILAPCVVRALDTTCRFEAVAPPDDCSTQIQALFPSCGHHSVA